MTGKRTAGRTASLAAVLCAVAIAGCAAIHSWQAGQVEPVLAAAGFRQKPADTPEKLAHLKTLTQRKLLPHENAGAVYYVYADADGCACLYVGDEAAYQRYQKLSIERKIAEDQRAAAAMRQTEAMDWGMWGPWNGDALGY